MVNFNKNKESKSTFVALFIVLFLTVGCTSSASKKWVKSYGQATTGLAVTVADTMEDVRLSEFSNRIATELYGVRTSEETFFKPAASITDEHKILVISILEELARYGKALEIIASDSELERIDKASTELYASLSGLNSTIQQIGGKEAKVLSEKNLGMIATAVDVLGRAYFEMRRMQALRDIVNEADTVIVSSVDTLKNEIPKWKEILGASLDAQKSSIFQVSQQPDYLLSTGAANIEYIQIRNILLEEATKLNHRKLNIEHEFNGITKGLSKLKEAHAKLKVALNNDSETKNLQGLISDISTIHKEIARIKIFRNGLSKLDKEL